MLNIPVPVCTYHAAVISEFFSKHDKLELARATVMARQAAEAKLGPSRLPAGELGVSVVYYIQLGQWVKIGTTTEIQQRVQSYPPMARLLVTEPGGYTLERKRHRQFNEYLIAGREWFDAGPRLRAHIDNLCAKACLSAPGLDND